MATAQRPEAPVPHEEPRPRRRRAVFLAAALAMAAGLAACTPAAPEPSGFQVLAGDAERADPSPEAARAAARATNAFGTDLFSALPDDGNLAISPYSVAAALAMTRAGAAGVTATEMDAVLHAAGLADLPAAFGSLDALLAERAGEYRAVEDAEPLQLDLSFANAVWPQDGFEFEEQFLQTLARHYGAGVNIVDYLAETEAARTAINEWVAEQTADRIPELIPAGILTAATRLVLTNTLYLNAPWLIPFETSQTADERFTLADGATVDVPFMHQEESLAYAADDAWQAVRMPYVGGELAMVVLLPEPGEFDIVASSLDSAAIDAISDALAPRDVRLALPKFEFRAPSGLNRALIELGMPSAFSDEADFSAMSPMPLVISDVIHETFISVDELGTEAAAATAVAIMETSAPTDVVDMTVDRPFLFWIVDEPTGALLFLGRVLDPSAS